MSLADTKILIKKSSKHPRDSDRIDFIDQVLLEHDKKANNKIDIFAMKNIFLNEAKQQEQTSTKATPNVTNVQLQKQRRYIASRQAAKKMNNQKRNKAKRSPLPQVNLSLIRQTQSEDNRSSSQNDSVLNYSQIESAHSQEFSDESNQDEINLGFINLESENQSDDAMNKTVVMSKKKAPREYETPKIQQKLTEKQIAQLQSVMNKFSLETLQQLYNKGKLREIEYLHILNFKKQEQRQKKQEKFTQNLQTIQRVANKIDRNYQLIEQKLFRSIENDRRKIKISTQKILEISKRKQKLMKIPNPEQSLLELKTLELIAQSSAKQKFLSILKCSRRDFRSEYNNTILTIQENKRKSQSVSQNLIFLEMKQILKKNQQNYQYIQSSLSTHRKTGKSLISCNARQHYLRLLSEKFSRQLIRIQQFRQGQMKSKVRKIIQDSNGVQITQELAKNFYKTIDEKVSEKLNDIKQKFITNLSWLRMIRQNGQLKQGNIFRKSSWILVNNLPFNLPISQQKQQYLIQNFKFYRRKVFKRIQAQFQTIKQLHEYSLTRQSIKQQKIQLKKKETVQNKMENLQKKLNNIEIYLENKNMKSILFYSKKPLKSSVKTKTKNYIENLNKSIQKLIRFEEKAEVLLFEKIEKIIQKKSKLIPANKVIKVDYRTQKIQEITKFSLQDKLNSEFKITYKLNDIRAQIKKDSQSFENLCMKLNKIDLNFKNCEDSPTDSQKEKKYTQSEKQKHMDKVYELIINNKISKADDQQLKSSNNKPYHVPSQYQEKWRYFQKMKFSHEKHLYKDQQFEFDEYLSNIERPNVSQKASTPHNIMSSTKKNVSVAEINNACHQFSKEFYKNPDLLEKLNLNQEQFYFLASPQYRNHCLQKKIKDQKLEQNILTLIRNNPYPINRSKYQHPEHNPINHMIQTDPYFQQRIQQYQQKIVKNQQLIDPYHPKLVYQSQSQDYSRRSSINSLFEPFDSRMQEIKAKRSLNYWSQKQSDFDTVDSEHAEYQSGLMNRF